MPPVTTVILGAGHRAHCLAELALHRPDLMKIVGVADLNPDKREYTAKRFNLTPEQCFESADVLYSKGKIADAVINGTGDAEHVPTTLPLLELGYDVLLEKPFAISMEELKQLDAAVKKYNRKVMICHELRYEPFYVEIKKRLLAGEVGEIFSIATAEHVSYHHYANAYVRGRWHKYAEGKSTFLMAKSCHDLDLITWYMSGVKPVRVSSMGSLRFFNKEHAPANSGTHCLVNCPCEKECIFSVGRFNLKHPQSWLAYLLPEIEYREHDIHDIEAGYRDTSRNAGRCVFKMDNDLVDRQHVMIEFENGVMATHELVGGSSRPMRKVHITGSKGELYGILEDREITICHAAPEKPLGEEFTVEKVVAKETGDLSGAMGDHGISDVLLPYDFVSLVRNEPKSISCTILEDSLNGHRIGFAADLAMKEHRVIEL